MTQQQQTEKIQSIRENYAAKEFTKLDELKKLDGKVHTPPKALAYVLGILGTLILGVGMCICLGVIAEGLMPVGVVVGCVGIAVITVNVFIYKTFLAKRKKKYGEQVLKLIDEMEA